MITKGSTPKNFTTDGINFIKIESISDLSNINLTKLAHISFAEHTGYLKRSILMENDILFSIAGALGNVYVVDKKILPANTNQALAIIRLKKQEYVNYISYYLQSKIIKNMINGSKSIGAQPNLSLAQISNIEVKLPTNDDLRNIKFLKLIDNRITAQKKIIEDISLLRLSICDISNRYEGDKYKIADIAELGRGRVINSKEISQQNNPRYPVYSSQTLNNGIMGYLDKYDFEGEYITWTTDGANAGTVFYHNEKFNCTNVCGTIKIIAQNIDPFYLSLILESACKKYVSSNLANPKLMNNTMASIIVSIPNIEIQNKICNIIKSLDKKILNEEKILKLYLKQKDYLLNHMFI